MKLAAIGVRMHSGWGALVAVSSHDGRVEVLDRRRVAVTTDGTPGVNQPYHFAQNLELIEAEKFLANCFAASQQLARAALEDVVGQLRARSYRVAGSAILLGSGRTLPALARILASHAMIHTAEGEFFREVVSNACRDLDLEVTGLRERELDETAHKALGREAGRICQQVSTLGRSVGPPWTTDQKTATLAALVVLQNASAA